METPEAQQQQQQEQPDNNGQIQNSSQQQIPPEKLKKTPKIFCKIEDHKNQKIKYLCPDQDYQGSSRFMCDHCNSDVPPQKKSIILILKELYNNKQESIKNWPDIAIKNENQIPFVKKQYSDSKKENQEIEDAIVKIEEYFQKLENEIVLKLNSIKKGAKLEIEKYQEQINKNNNNLYKDLKKIFDIAPLKKIIEEFEQKDLQTLNQDLKDSVSNISSQFSDNNLQDQIQNIKFNHNMVPIDIILKDFEKQTTPLIQNLDEFQKLSSKLLFRQPNLKMNKSSYPNSAQFTEITENFQDSNNNVFSQKITFKIHSNYIPIFSERFSSQTQQQFKFKIFPNNNNKLSSSPHFSIGIVKDGGHESQHLIWPQSGNAVDINHTSQKYHKHEFEYSEKEIKEVMFEGVELKVDILVEENILNIFALDTNGETLAYVKNKFTFEPSEYYRFCICCYAPSVNTDLLFY